MNCKYCRANCTGARQDREIALCLGYDPPKTNADRIRAMSDMEIASFFYWDVDGSGRTQWQWLEWLRQECAE